MRLFTDPVKDPTFGKVIDFAISDDDIDMKKRVRELSPPPHAKVHKGKNFLELDLHR